MDIESMIKAKKEEKQKVLDQMKVQKEIFLNELAKFTTEWFEKETLSTIKSNSEKVFELGEEKARELKNKIKELQDKTPELVSQYLSDDHLWWHTNEDNTSYYGGNRRLIDKQDNKIRELFGELGKILIDFGIVKASSDYMRDYHSNWTHVEFSSSKLKYRISIDYSGELYNINSEYIKLIDQAQKVNGEIKKLEDKKKRENVGEWWKTL